MIRKSLLSILGLLVLASCSTMPDPAVSKYVTTEGAGFPCEFGGGYIKYGIAYTLNQAFVDPVYLTVEFENPSNPNSPLVSQFTVPAGSRDTIYINSPKMDSIQNNRNYKVVLKLFNNPERTGLFATHKDEVRLQLPKQMFNQIGIREL